MRSENKNTSRDLFIFFLGLNVLFGFLNNNQYMLLSGFYIFLIPAIGFGIMEMIFKQKVYFSMELFGYAILIVLTIFGAIFAGSRLSSGVFLSFLLIFIIGFLITGLSFEQRHMDFLLECLKYGAFIFSILMIVNPVDYWGGGWRYSVQFGSGPVFDPNYLGAILSSGLASAVYAICNKKDTKSRFLNIGIAFVIGVTVLLSGSRAAMLSTAVFVLFLLIQIMYDKNKGLKEIIRNILIIIFIFVLIYIMISKLPVNVYARLFVSSYRDGSNARRVRLWMNALNNIKNHPFLGVGCIEENVSIGNPAHNTFLSVWLDLGIGALMILLMTIAKIFHFFMKKRQFLLMGLVIQSLATSFIIGEAFFLEFWLILMIGSMLIRQKK